MRARRSEGFTLVEVVIALAILAFALFGAISVISYTTRMNTSARERMLALRAAEKKIEQMLSSDFSSLYTNYQLQTEGVGWEMVPGLEPVDPAPLPPPTDQPAYVYPTWNPKVGTPPDRAVLFVRFPLSANGASFSEGPDAVFPGTGTFTDSYVVDVNGKIIPDGAGHPQPVDMDMDGNGSKTDTFLVTNISHLRFLPVSIEVYWRGVVGPTHGSIGNTYLKYRYIFRNPTPT